MVKKVQQPEKPSMPQFYDDDSDEEMEQEQMELLK